MDWSAITEGAIFFISSAALCVAFWVRSTSKSTAQDCVDETLKELMDGKVPNAIDTRIERVANLLFERINSHDTRIVRIESALADLPRSKDLHAIALQVTEMVGELKGMRGELHSQGDQFKRLERQFDKVEQWAKDAAKDAAESRNRE